MADNTKVNNGKFALRGFIDASELRIVCKTIWPKADSGISLCLTIPEAKVFTFSNGGLASDYVDQELVQHHFVEGVENRAWQRWGVQLASYCTDCKIGAVKRREDHGVGTPLSPQRQSYDGVSGGSRRRLLAQFLHFRNSLPSGTEGLHGMGLPHHASPEDGLGIEGQPASAIRRGLTAGSGCHYGAELQAGILQDASHSPGQDHLLHRASGGVHRQALHCHLAEATAGTTER
jgi:hypothetical protein